MGGRISGMFQGIVAIGILFALAIIVLLKEQRDKSLGELWRARLITLFLLLGVVNGSLWAFISAATYGDEQEIISFFSQWGSIPRTLLIGNALIALPIFLLSWLIIRQDE